MKTKIGISAENREKLVQLLNTLLADEFVLYVKTRNFHWNVFGMHFHDLHKFFESQYEALDEVVDQVAERARALGGFAYGSLAEFLKVTRLKEVAGQPLESKAMLKALLEDHESIIRILRKDVKVSSDEYGDAGTSDFLTGLMEAHEKMAWMLRSFLGSSV